MIPRPTGAHLEHMGRGAADAAGMVVPGGHLLEDTHDETSGVDEQHVES